MDDTAKLPASLTVNPRLDQWVKFEDDRTVRVATGKVEIGQGITTALVQIAAEELDLPLKRIMLLSGNTELGPDERYTSSSWMTYSAHPVQVPYCRTGALCASTAGRVLPPQFAQARW